MHWKNLVEAVAHQRVETDRLAEIGRPATPSSETIAFFVRWQRGMMGWKREVLAGFARVSLSTIERVERGEAVSAESLDRIAEALRQPPGAFTALRIPLSTEKAWRKLDEGAALFDGTVAVPVRPLRGHRQIAMLAQTHLFIIDASRLDDGCDADVDNLREWLDLASFVLASEEKNSIIHTDAEPVKRRELYNDILRCVREIERNGHAVALAGTYQAQTNSPMLPKADVALIGFFPKKTDPAAYKRERLFAPEHADLVSVWKQFCAEAG